MSAANPVERLVDNFGRTVNYVRISVTDRCDFRCVYCMAEEMEFVPRAQLLTLEELGQIARAFTELGVGKIRITGGEPLIRRNVLKLFHDIGALPGLRELALTTNGSQLRHMAAELRAAGVRRVNISLDSLDAERFRRITRVGDLATVHAGIDAALAAGFERVKLNAVILRNRNHDEVADLVRFAVDRSMDISFIEEMPLGVIGDHDRAEAYYSSDRIRADLEQAFTLVPTTENTGGPSRYYRIPGTDTRVGFISPHSHNFCDTCNRVRLTCEGRLLLCLGQEHSVDLRHVVRANPGDMDALKQAIRDSMRIKPRGHEFDLATRPVIFRHMNVTGG
jgi:cyclic pyranopterin phosphate synthase